MRRMKLIDSLLQARFRDTEQKLAQATTSHSSQVAQLQSQLQQANSHASGSAAQAKQAAESLKL